MKNPRIQAVELLSRVLQHKDSLASLPVARNPEDSSSIALARELCLGVCRYYPLLKALADSLMKKPLKNKDSDVLALILIGLYQLFYMRVPDHAALNETVNCVRKSWARGLVNAVLRNAKRQFPDFPEQFPCSFALRHAHPEWLVDRLKFDWPEHLESILVANNARAPMTLRLNLANTTRQNYLQLLAHNDIKAHPGQLTQTAILLETPTPVLSLPGFQEGLVSVQDEASQIIPTLLSLSAGQNVLDACAAPGGKTMALLQTEPNLQITAIDNDERRLERMKENLDRLQQTNNVRLLCADAMQITGSVANETFDRILVDAPCSATGVIRRHPDIKVLRKPEHLNDLIQKQAQLLDALWPQLGKNGLLLYSTCSTLKSENVDQILTFLKKTPDAQHVPLNVDWGLSCEVGQQLLPGTYEQDGFYYALLQKC